MNKSIQNLFFEDGKKEFADMISHNVEAGIINDIQFEVVESNKNHLIIQIGPDYFKFFKTVNNSSVILDLVLSVEPKPVTTIAYFETGTAWP